MSADRFVNLTCYFNDLLELFGVYELGRLDLCFDVGDLADQRFQLRLNGCQLANSLAVLLIETIDR